MLYSGGDDGTIRQWGVESGRERAVFEGDTFGVLSLALLPDKRVLAAGNFDGSIKLWDVARRCELGLLGRHRKAVFAVAAAPDGQALASGCMDGTVKVWRAVTDSKRARVGRWRAGRRQSPVPATRPEFLKAARGVPSFITEDYLMLVLSRKIGERIVIAGGVTVTVLAVNGQQVRLGIEALKSVSIRRAELAPLTDKRPSHVS